MNDERNRNDIKTTSDNVERRRSRGGLIIGKANDVNGEILFPGHVFTP